MGNAWDINDDTADSVEQQDVSKSGGIPTLKVETNEQPSTETDENKGDSDDRGLNRAVSGSDS